MGKDKDRQSKKSIKSFLLSEFFNRKTFYQDRSEIKTKTLVSC